MNNILAAYSLPWHAAFLLAAIALWRTEIIWLRGFMLAATVLGLLMALQADLPNWLAPWLAVISAINLWQLVAALRESARHRLPASEAPLLRSVLPSLNDSQIARLIKAADWTDLAPGEILTRQDVPVDALYFLCEGRASVQIDKSLVTYLEKGSFVGEIAYLTGNPATATVTIEEQARALVFSRMRMAKVFSADPETNSILYELLGRDLATKMRRSNTRRVLTEPEDGFRV